ncbi:MAG: TIGR03936 family radical SAM-associated protein [Armatimonadetes bacterium]|nr:TIGR03936 family radical SAM-associated protein [Armatimonadota bacterium]
MSELEIRTDRPGGEYAPAVVVQRIQFRFSKGAEVRFISHLDLLRTFERAMRRSKLPLAFSQGYNPRPRISIYVPLPVGSTSEAELGSADLSEPLESGEFSRRMNAALPPSLRILAEEEIPYEGAHAASKIDTAEYRVEAAAPQTMDEAEVRDTVEAFLAAESWPFVRQGGKGKGSKTVDLRPPVLALEVLDVEGDRAAFRMEVNIGGEGGARPREIVAALAEKIPGLEERRTHRCRLYRRE